MTKRGSEDSVGGLAKQARTDDGEDELIVYQPSIVPPELKSKMNSLVEVLLPARYLTAEHKQVRARQQAQAQPDPRQHGASGLSAFNALLPLLRLLFFLSDSPSSLYIS